jgi:predicted transglutaminase-like cysteine proteinase
LIVLRERVSNFIFLVCTLSLAACQTVPSSPQLDITSSQPIPQTVLLSSTAMPSGAPTDSAPPGFISFCNRFMDQCVASQNNAPVVHLDLGTQAVLDTVNRSVNRSIWPESDERHYGVAEYWDIPKDGYGNCHDYALTKRKQLIDAGLPERALRIAIVITPRQNRHAVLTVTTDRGDLVLDNLSDTLKPWRDVDYQWIERQDSEGGFGWVNLSTAVALNSTGSSTSVTK